MGSGLATVAVFYNPLIFSSGPRIPQTVEPDWYGAEVVHAEDRGQGVAGQLGGRVPELHRRGG